MSGESVRLLSCFDSIRIVDTKAMLITDTHVSDIEEAFKQFTNREDIGIILISQYVSIANTLGTASILGRNY